MDIRTYVRGIDALVARGQPITTENLDDVAAEIHLADRGGTPPPPSLPGQDLRIQLHAFGANEGAYDSDWDAYVQGLDSQGYDIRWSSTSPSQLSPPVDDDGTGYSNTTTSHSAADDRGPYALLDHQPTAAPQQTRQQGSAANVRAVLERAKNALYRGTATERARRAQERRHRTTTTDDGTALGQ